MSESENIITIKILDRSYNIKCPAEEANQLHEAARYVDEQMRKLRQAGGITSTDRVAVVTALNICHEMMMLKKQNEKQIDMTNDRIVNLQNRIENFLAQQEEMPV